MREADDILSEVAVMAMDQGEATTARRVRTGANAVKPEEQERIQLYGRVLAELRRRGITLADIVERLRPIAEDGIADKKLKVNVSVATLSALPRNLAAYSYGQRQAAERLLRLFLAQALVVLKGSTGRS